MESSSSNVEGYSSGSYREFFASQRHVSYSCGSCGYDLNLSSSNRNTIAIGSKYGKSIKRGIISFFQIDDSRFVKVDEIRCVPLFFSKRYWGLFHRRTKLLCRKCGAYIGSAYDDESLPNPVVTEGSNANPTTSEPVKQRKFDIRIQALQPSCSDQTQTPPII